MQIHRIMAASPCSISACCPLSSVLESGSHRWLWKRVFTQGKMHHFYTFLVPVILCPSVWIHGGFQLWAHQRPACSVVNNATVQQSYWRNSEKLQLQAGISQGKGLEGHRGAQKNTSCLTSFIIYLSLPSSPAFYSHNSKFDFSWNIKPLHSIAVYSVV